MKHFWRGFEKQAAIFRNVKGFRVFKPGKDTNDRMIRLANHQPFISRILSLVAKASGVSKGAVQDDIREHLRSLLASDKLFGTFARGKKGTRAYVASPKSFKGTGVSFRGTVNHEGFHVNAPILGHSEAAAHFYGGLKSKKGKNSYGEALKEALIAFPSARPGRALLEYGGAVGGAVGVHHLIKKKDKDKHEKTAKDGYFKMRAASDYIDKAEQEPWKNELPGGKGEHLAPKCVDHHQLAQGLMIEREHTPKKHLATEIALDHLAEHPDYYTRLKKAKL